MWYARRNKTYFPQTCHNNSLSNHQGMCELLYTSPVQRSQQFWGVWGVKTSDRFLLITYSLGSFDISLPPWSPNYGLLAVAKFNSRHAGGFTLAKVCYIRKWCSKVIIWWPSGMNDLYTGLYKGLLVRSLRTISHDSMWASAVPHAQSCASIFRIQLYTINTKEVLL